MRTPRLILTSDKWSNITVVVFDDDLDIDCIPDDWVYDRIQQAEDEGRELTKEDAIAELIDELHEDNDAVDEYWIDDKVCRCGDDYYKYYDDCTARPIDK